MVRPNAAIRAETRQLPLYEARTDSQVRARMIMVSHSSRSAAPLDRRTAFVRAVLSDLAIMTGVGLFFGILGPFGSAEQSLPVRIASWLAFAYIGYAFYRPMSPVVNWAQATLHLPRFGLWIAAVLAATVPMTAAVLAIGNLDDPLRWPGMEIALTTYFYVFVIGGAVTLLFNVLPARDAAPAAPNAPLAPPDIAPEARRPQPAAQATPANPLFDALAPELGSDVIALEMEDHYVRVHTALGSELVLMRLRDAIAHLGAVEGRQVHRSWWVARGAVEDARREGRNVRLILPRGIEAPVARAQIAELRDAGWI
jgi:hypothetical protein